MPHFRGALLGLTAIVATGTASAADLPVPADTVEIVAPVVESRWSFAVAPYLWAAAISGDVAQFGLPAQHIDASFSDVFSNLDFAAMIVSEIRYGRFGLFTDLVYVKLSGVAESPDPFLATTGSLDTQTLAFTAAPEFRLVESPLGSLDVMAGARLWSVDTDVSFEGGLLGGVSVSDDDTWVDPVIGFKGRFNVTPKIYLTGWAMAGGFGVSSDFMWDLWGGAGYEVNKTISGVIGYRGMGVDYENDGFIFDVIQHGPVIGAVVRF